MTHSFLSRLKSAMPSSDEPEVVYARMHRYWRVLLLIACVVTIGAWTTATFEYSAIANTIGTDYGQSATTATSTAIREQLSVIAEVFQTRAENTANFSSQLPHIVSDPSQ